jgi:hypothetical protein
LCALTFGGAPTLLSINTVSLPLVMKYIRSPYSPCRSSTCGGMDPSVYRVEETQVSVSIDLLDHLLHLEIWSALT